MSIFAGAISLGPETEIPPRLRGEIRAAVSRYAGEAVIEHSVPSAYLAKVDLGLFGGRGVHVDEAARVSALAGDPFVATQCGLYEDRDDSLRGIHDALISGDCKILTRCRGSYCLAHIDPANRTVVLACDKVGVRPLYY